MENNKLCIRKRTNTGGEDSFTSFAKQADVYGETVGFQTNGSSSYKTVFGSIITIMIVTVILGYTAMKAC